MSPNYFKRLFINKSKIKLHMICQQLQHSFLLYRIDFYQIVFLLHQE